MAPGAVAVILGRQLSVVRHGESENNDWEAYLKEYETGRQVFCVTDALATRLDQATCRNLKGIS